MAIGLIKAGAVGEVLCHFLDVDGNVVDHPVSRRVVAVGLADLRRVPKIVIAAGGRRKVNAIQAALKATDLNANQVVTGYNGVKFDDKGQNTLASSLITQLQRGQYVPVWPKDKAVGELMLPYKGW